MEEREHGKRGHEEGRRATENRAGHAGGTTAGAQATLAATQAGATSTLAATQAGLMSTIVVGSVSLIIGIFLGLTIVKSKA